MIVYASSGSKSQLLSAAFVLLAFLVPPPHLRTLRVHGCRGSVAFLCSSNKRREASRRCLYRLSVSKSYGSATKPRPSRLHYWPFRIDVRTARSGGRIPRQELDKLVGFETDGVNPGRGKLQNSPGGKVRNQ